MSSDEVIRKMIEGHRHAQIQHEFKQVDRRTLLNLSDSELALWQSDYPQNSPHYILAEFEWQRRLNHEQVKATKHAAWLGLAGVVLGFSLAQIPIYLSNAKTNDNTSQEKPTKLLKPSPLIEQPVNQQKKAVP